MLCEVTILLENVYLSSNYSLSGVFTVIVCFMIEFYLTFAQLAIKEIRLKGKTEEIGR